MTSRDETRQYVLAEPMSGQGLDQNCAYLSFYILIALLGGLEIPKNGLKQGWVFADFCQ